MAINELLGQKRRGYGSVAQVQLSLGKPDAALKAYNDALKIREDWRQKRGIVGRPLHGRGQPTKRCKCSKSRCRFSVTLATRPIRHCA